jgi:hypothetical protein
MNRRMGAAMQTKGVPLVNAADRRNGVVNLFAQRRCAFGSLPTRTEGRATRQRLRFAADARGGSLGLHEGKA